MKRKIINDFHYRGLSALGLARKYGMTVLQIEEIIRKEMRRKRI